MEAYTSFAQVYDQFMDNVPYEDGCKYLVDLLTEYGISDGLVAELGCGTGNLTELLAKAGYDMIGIDNSVEMLDLARGKQAEHQDLPEGAKTSDILYLLQDMREFELYGTVRGIISFCDSVNYVLEPEELLQVFKLVNNYLDPKGVFIFDFHTRYYYEQTLGDATFAEDREDISFIWDNYYDEETCINEYLLSIFMEEESGLYRKFQEEHFQRGYSLDEIQALLEQSGLVFEAAYDDMTKNAPSETSERIYVIARESGK